MSIKLFICSLFKQSLYMVYTIYNVLFSDGLHRLMYYRFMAIRNGTCQPLSSQALELLFNFAKYELDRIVIRRVRHIVSIFKTQSLHRIFAFLRCMRRKIIHEYAYLFPFIIIPQFSQVFLELGDINRKGKYHIGFHTFFFRYS